MENIKDLVIAECKLLGYKPKTEKDYRDLAKLIEVLDRQSTEFGEIGISAACIGFLVAKGKF